MKRSSAANSFPIPFSTPAGLLRYNLISAGYFALALIYELVASPWINQNGVCLFVWCTNSTSVCCTHCVSKRRFVRKNDCAKHWQLNAQLEVGDRGRPKGRERELCVGGGWGGVCVCGGGGGGCMHH